MQDENEKITDFKSTLEKFIKSDEPELEQEEEIMKYGENKNKKASSDSDIDGNSEEKEHLNRVKRELLESLKRVEALEKKVFKENNLGDKIKSNMKVDQGGKRTEIKSIEELNYISQRDNQSRERE